MYTSIIKIKQSKKYKYKYKCTGICKPAKSRNNKAIYFTKQDRSTINLQKDTIKIVRTSKAKPTKVITLQ
jgi:hypothetical protein